MNDRRGGAGAARLLRQHVLQMDVVFVSEFTNGRRVFRHVDTAPGHDVIAAGQSDPGRNLVPACGRWPPAGLIRTPPSCPPAHATAPPLRIGAHPNTPVVLGTDSVYGALCCFSFTGNDRLTDQDLKKLRYTAKCRRLERSTRRASQPPVALTIPTNLGWRTGATSCQVTDDGHLPCNRKT